MSKSAIEPATPCDHSNASPGCMPVADRRRFLGLAVLSGLFASASFRDVSIAAPSSGTDTYDVVIQNGKVVDGSGNPWFYADVAIKDGRIAKIGRIDPKLGKRV